MQTLRRTSAWPGTLRFPPSHRPIFSPACLRYGCRYLSTQAQLDSQGRPVQYYPPKGYKGADGNITFEQAGLTNSLAQALEKAFPYIEFPTYVQWQLIEAIGESKDVYLKDHTGTGKSIGVLLALWNKRRKEPSLRGHGGGPEDAVRSHSGSITSLVIVPHRDLAYQYMHWVKSIHAHGSDGSPIESIAQVVVRNAADSSLSDKISSLREHPPHILIGTPQALLDVLHEDPHAIPLHSLSAIFVDECDYLIETVPRNGDKYDKLKLERMIRKHPSPARQILDSVYNPKYLPLSGKQRAKVGKHFTPTNGQFGFGRPQLILASATFRVALKNQLFGSGWFKWEPGRLVRINGHDIKDSDMKPTVENRASLSLGGTSIRHHVLIVSRDGKIVNYADARSLPNNEDGEEAEMLQPPEYVRSLATPTLSQPSTAMETFASKDIVDASTGSKVSAVQIDPSDVPAVTKPGKGRVNPPAIHSSILEAVAETFARDVPRLALLIVHAETPVLAALHELRSLGVNAQTLDVFEADSHLKAEADGTAVDNPTLLVATLAGMRGLDLPDLTHVFLYNILDDKPVDTYLHAAGRVGRFGRSGKVVLFAEAPRHVMNAKGKLVHQNDSIKIKKLFSALGTSPSKCRLFP
ncbi:nucleoside triphosphate hydrolase protein [Wolfiporia cocos MD-104 SS10]|uniref:RNA helicase n=1 Tax=Wolfiporia cocos (strain MD-104) TaxID=742152 RepID=A0A2H3IWP7_WOLCO|nr:nucleoside triphosphate hydrolase protein [Wolfiporia cocos MD-104 SS10]